MESYTTISSHQFTQQNYASFLNHGVVVSAWQSNFMDTQIMVNICNSFCQFCQSKPSVEFYKIIYEKSISGKTEGAIKNWQSGDTWKYHGISYK